jgi:anthranilate/para-aminobenzoate synthase component II
MSMVFMRKRKMIYHATVYDRTPFLPKECHSNDYQIAYNEDSLKEKKGMLLLWGGEDVSPSLYNQTCNSFTIANEQPSQRDVREWKLINKAIQLSIPIVGICRGAQLLCAKAGGTLVQHVTGHGRPHLIRTYDKKEYTVTSSHHQMMNPRNTEHTLLAWSRELSKCFLVEDDQEITMEIEPEIVYFPKIKALAIQAHPEWLPMSDKFNGYLKKLINRYLMSDFFYEELVDIPF